MGVFTAEKLNSDEGRNLKNQNGKFITQCEKESIGHIGDNPFISSILCGAFTISNSVSIRLGYGADVSVSVPDSFVRFFYLTLLCHPRFKFVFYNQLFYFVCFFQVITGNLWMERLPNVMCIFPFCVSPHPRRHPVYVHASVDVFTRSRHSLSPPPVILPSANAQIDDVQSSTRLFY